MRCGFAMVLLVAALMIVPLSSASVCADGEVIGGEGHGSGIDAIYTSQGVGEGNGLLYIKLSSVPTKDVFVIVVSGSYSATYGLLKPLSEFKIDVAQLDEGTYDLLVVIADTGVTAAECELVIGSSASVSFDSNGGAGGMSPVSVPFGSTYALPECGFAAPAGKYFEGWSLDSDPETVVEPGETVVVDGPIVATAVWGDIIYTITFLPGDGSGSMDPVKAVYGQELVLPDCAFRAPEDKGFSGWSVDGKMYRSGDVYVVHGDAEITAQWEKGTDTMLIVAIVLVILILLLLIAVLVYRRRRGRE